MSQTGPVVHTERTAVIARPGWDISVTALGEDDDGRRIYHYAIVVDAQAHRDSDLKSGARGVGGRPVEMMQALLSFLLAAAEAHRNGPASENYSMFPEWVNEWADEHQSDLVGLQWEIEEVLS